MQIRRMQSRCGLLDAQGFPQVTNFASGAIKSEAHLKLIYKTRKQKPPNEAVFCFKNIVKS